MEAVVEVCDSCADVVGGYFKTMQGFKGKLTGKTVAQTQRFGIFWRKKKTPQA